LLERRSSDVEADDFPDIIDLPNGWLPEGVAVGEGPVIYAGSRRHGAVYAADLRTGEGKIVVPEQTGRIAVGLAFDSRSDNIFVAGGPGGAGYVYNANAENKMPQQTYQFVTDGGTTFVNDVDVARDAAYFTDSARPVIYKVPLGDEGALGSSFEEIRLPTGFNLNGIVATPDGKTLIGVQSGMGVLVRVDLATIDESNVAASVIDLGGYSVAQGDGLLLEGKTIYVMRNRAEIIAEIRLSRDWTKGELQRELTDPNFDVPTTIDRFRNTIYAVNARFGTEDDGTLPYTIVGVDFSDED
jgi:sugar lactone lactonase YvrE